MSKHTRIYCHGHGHRHTTQTDRHTTTHRCMQHTHSPTEAKTHNHRLETDTHYIDTPSHTKAHEDKLTKAAERTLTQCQHRSVHTHTHTHTHPGTPSSTARPVTHKGHESTVTQTSTRDRVCAHSPSCKETEVHARRQHSQPSPGQQHAWCNICTAPHSDPQPNWMRLGGLEWALRDNPTLGSQCSCHHLSSCLSVHSSVDTPSLDVCEAAGTEPGLLMQWVSPVFVAPAVCSASISKYLHLLVSLFLVSVSRHLCLSPSLCL